MVKDSALAIGAGTVAAVFYKVKDAEGRELDSNSRHGHKPLVFLYGAGNVVPGLEKLLEGKRKDDYVTGEVAAADAYGPHRPDLVEVLNRGAIPMQEEPQPGMVLAGVDGQGRRIRALVTAVEGDKVTLDKNHPMAGKSLFFEVTVAGVRPATQEEVAHGHPHGPGGHQH